ncbi:hypothetical protein L7F22_014813 [Adiantum nelumboides]|nr:hypothetical protein [Adiantum nelumboides]
MDSLLSKMGPLKALVPVKKVLHSEGIDVSQTQPRPIHVCVCRSLAADSKPSSAIASKMQETSTDAALGSLPLPSSRALVPPPLRFLWFTRKSSNASVEDREGSHSGIDISKVPSTPSHGSIDEDGTSSSALSTQSIGESLSSSTDLKESDTCSEDMLTECNKAASMQEMHLDSMGQSDSSISNAILANEDSSTTKSWISRITDFKAFWPSHKAPIAAQDLLKTKSSSAEEDLAPPTASNCDGTCDGCEVNDCYGCSLEVPYAKVLHSKETFAKFLQDASLFDMKVLAQMSFLCDMSYMIPDIQPGQLLRYHHLKFVTSSLEKKAEAETVADLQKRAARSEKFVSSGGDRTISEGKTADLVHATYCAEAKSDGLQANTGNPAKPKNVEHKVGTSISQGDSEPSDEESFMAVAPVTAVVLAEEETKRAVAKDLQTSSSCPCEWFICDDESSRTRFFVIQGSESVASWQTNLFFEPTKFEGLDVIVHRGIYEAANALYEQVLPEVLAHFSAHGELSQLRLTGHSLGGSLATLLALMFQIRGVLPRNCILPVVTFGSPCVMCGGDSLLHKMDLPASHIQSIIMHRDVVPRAFSCDYPDRAAQILKRLNGKFRDHPCLNNQKLLYAPMGQLLILQPDETTAPSHPLLPCGYGLYLLRHPTNERGVEIATELRGAQRAFLNMPHPLEILSDPGAYGLNGAISRDHNPRSYTKAIHLVLKHEVKRLRRVQREQRRQLWWPLVISETSWFAQRGQNVSSIVDHDNTDGALTPAICKSSLFSSHTMAQGKFSAFKVQIGFPLTSSSLWESQKAAVSRYARLIASKHVHLGMLFIVSLRVVIVECLQTIYVWI